MTLAAWVQTTNRRANNPPLRERESKAGAREALIHDVSRHKYDVGSNVVDAVIKSLRKKLGTQSELIETVAGYGYKFRAAA